jgi:hypothetical protein
MMQAAASTEKQFMMHASAPADVRRNVNGFVTNTAWRIRENSCDVLSKIADENAENDVRRRRRLKNSSWCVNTRHLPKWSAQSFVILSVSANVCLTFWGLVWLVGCADWVLLRCSGSTSSGLFLDAVCGFSALLRGFLFPGLFLALPLLLSCVVVLGVSPFPASVDARASLTGLAIP